MNRIAGHMCLYEMLNLVLSPTPPEPHQAVRLGNDAVAIAGFRGAFASTIFSRHHCCHDYAMHSCTVTPAHQKWVLNVGIIFAMCVFVLPELLTYKVEQLTVVVCQPLWSS